MLKEIPVLRWEHLRHLGLKAIASDWDGTAADTTLLYSKIDWHVIHNPRFKANSEYPIIRKNFQMEQECYTPVAPEALEYAKKLIDAYDLESFTPYQLYSLLTLQKERDGFLGITKEKGEKAYLAYAKYLIETYKLNNISPKELHEYRWTLADKLLSKTRFKPGYIDFMLRMKNEGYAIGIATMSTLRQVKSVFTNNPQAAHKLKLEDFEFMGTEHVERNKPDPEIYRKIVERFGCKPEECLALEDALTGLKSAVAAGLSVAYVPDVCSESDKGQIQELLLKCKTPVFQISRFADVFTM